MVKDFFYDDEALISVQLSFLRYYALFDKLIHLSIGSVLMLYLEIKNGMTKSILSVKHLFHVSWLLYFLPLLLLFSSSEYQTSLLWNLLNTVSIWINYLEIHLHEEAPFIK